jgi:hypothetical protein
MRAAASPRSTRLRSASAAVLALAAALAGCAGFAPPDRDSCPALGPAETASEIDPASTVRDDSRSLAELSRLQGLGIGHRALGVTESKLRIWMAPDLRVAAASPKGVCLHVARVVLHAGYAERTVRIARELAGDACLRRRILEHEMRHVALDDAILIDLQPEIRRVLAAGSASLDGVWGADQPAAEVRLRERLVAIRDQVLDEIEVTRRRRHEIEVDTPDERRRSATMCGGKLLELGLS